MSEIITKHGEVKAIASLMKTTERTVYNALKGITNSNLAARIRKIAINRGGAVINN